MSPKRLEQLRRSARRELRAALFAPLGAALAGIATVASFVVIGVGFLP